MKEQNIPLEKLRSIRDLRLEEQAEMLLGLAYDRLIAPRADEAITGSLDQAVADICDRQMFHECLESVCRPLSKHDVRDLAEFMLVKLCERIAPAVS